MQKSPWIGIVRYLIVMVIAVPVLLSDTSVSIKMVVLAGSVGLVVFDILINKLDRGSMEPSGRIIIDTTDSNKDTISIEYYGHPLNMSDKSRVYFDVTSDV